ncbi:methionine adenosyltransferase [Pampinifervens florentissimum]|uniref:methionine adenosyltransferase n=1 Tax=Pampinifervens florentissimum TaxID=1632019 RepID=UPI0013B496B2|nr:methionine adenosyltransferase [Hydrogenobacter sp. T-8]QID33983.1 methionine adenosyltransferase [Hydrogenobacter sp. T-8]
MANIVITPMTFRPTYELDAEIVERKGTGHPDTICDYLAENLSRELCLWYLREYGAVMHHNVDKALLVGGVARAEFGGGEVIEPIEIYLVGRAILEKDGKRLDVHDLAVESAKRWLRENIKNLDVERHVVIHTKIKPGSRDLVELFERFQKKGEVPLANDTSFGVGYAPLDSLERAVFEAERFLNSEEIKKEHPEIGEDIKVMGVRIRDKFRLTIALAFVGKYIKDIQDYFQKKEEIRKKVKERVEAVISKEVDIFINTADSKENNSVYITVTGTSAEQGDDGQVGRGNRVNGLITPYRPMSLEAAAGKNPISHIGKIYNRVANLIAQRVVKEVEEVEEAYCYIVSQIGKPINEPQVLDVSVRTKKDLKSLEELVRKIAQEELDKMPEVWKGFVEGLYPVA